MFARGGKISFSEGGSKYRFRIEIFTPELTKRKENEEKHVRIEKVRETQRKRGEKDRKE